MPIFQPNEPQNGEHVDADVLRDQFNSLKELIDAIAPALAETDPVFAAWLAAMPPISAFTNDAGYVANPATADLDANNHNLVNVLSLAFGGNTLLDLSGAQLKDGTPGGNSGTAISLRNRQLVNQYATPLADWSGNALNDGQGNAFLTTASAPPVNAAEWATNAPATLADWMLRVTALLSNNGANPIP